MASSRRFLALLLTGLMLFVGITMVVFKRTEPAQAVADSPVMVAVTTTTTLPPTTQPAEPTTTLDTVPPATVKKPVTPPRNSYAPEPIIEIGTMEIPKIGLVHKVMHGITLRNIDHGPSHWPGTPLPGERGNTVFAGHRVTHSHPFRRIDELKPGDEIIFNINGVRSRYLMSGSEVVTPDRVDIADPTPTPTVTLFACHPPGSARYRYVVRGDLVQADGNPPPAQG